MMLIFENYEKPFLNKVAMIKDSKGMSAIDYAEQSSNEALKKMFFSIIDPKFE